MSSAMSLGDRLGAAGLIVGLFGIAAFYLWPDRKWIGWLSFTGALALAVVWVWSEFRTQIVAFSQDYPIRSTLVVFFGAGILASGLWILTTRKVAAPATSVSGQATAPEPSSPAANVEGAPPAPPIEGLSELGWTVQPGTTEIQFEVANKPLPDMKASARYFRSLHKPFRLHLQSVNGINGLHLLADINECRKIEINAGEFSDISELRGFSRLASLGISQTPLNALSTVDSSPLSALTSLRELNLYSTRITDLGPIAKLSHLTTLNLKGTLVRDLSPIAGLTLLESVDVTDTAVVDLSPLAHAASLRELGIDGKQAPGLARLTNLEHLRTLRIIDQSNVDLSAVGQLTNLESLFVWGPLVLNLSPLRTLDKLQELQIMGFAMRLSAVTGVDALGDLKNLRRLTLGYMQVSDLTFVRNLAHLKEINIGMMPVSSVAPLGGLSSLESVSLSRTNVVDISPLLDLPQLRKLSVQGSPARSDVLTELERRGVTIQR
jgi:Leucine-rich repeat (LRR) protein